MSLIVSNQSSFFAPEDLPVVSDFLVSIDENRLGAIDSMDFKDPKIAFILSILTGCVGVDRFYIGDTFLGVIKFLTFGGLGVWYLFDVFRIKKTTQKKNFQKFLSIAQVLKK